MDEKCTQLWEKVCGALELKVSPGTFKRWFSGVQLIGATENALTFRVPNTIYQFWIESNHMAALQAAIVSAFGSPRAVKFSCASEVPGKLDEEILPEISEKEFDRQNTRDAKQSSTALGLNPRNTFESLVVGLNNDIALDARTT